jgi:hypothetical protein
MRTNPTDLQETCTGRRKELLHTYNFFGAEVEHSGDIQTLQLLLLEGGRSVTQVKVRQDLFETVDLWFSWHFQEYKGHNNPNNSQLSRAREEEEETSE